MEAVVILPLDSYHRDNEDDRPRRDPLLIGEPQLPNRRARMEAIAPSYGFDADRFPALGGMPGGGFPGGNQVGPDHPFFQLPRRPGQDPSRGGLYPDPDSNIGVPVPGARFDPIGPLGVPPPDGQPRRQPRLHPDVMPMPDGPPPDHMYM